jgi:hypothetical protein
MSLNICIIFNSGMVGAKKISSMKFMEDIRIIYSTFLYYLTLKLLHSNRLNLNGLKKLRLIIMIQICAQLNIQPQSNEPPVLSGERSEKQRENHPLQTRLLRYFIRGAEK